MNITRTQAAIAAVIVAVIAVVVFMMAGGSKSKAASLPAVPTVAPAVVVSELSAAGITACQDATPVNEIGALPGAMSCGEDITVYQWESAAGIRADLKSAGAASGTLVLVGATVIETPNAATAQQVAKATGGEVWNG